MVVVVLILLLVQGILTFQPDFIDNVANISVPLGRDATFTCQVRHLGGYRVGWLKADTKAIQAIHENVITHNPRVTVSHLDQNTWNLHIKSVVEDDRGGYMCQLNTDPMKSQIGFLDVVIPPDFISEDTSSDVIVLEGSSVRLTCRAHGYPEPIVTWRREDGSEIILKDNLGTKNLVLSYRGEVLKLTKVSRHDMGSYLCIASNGVPPSVSKRISLSIHFHPVIQVPNQLVGAPLGTDIQIECHVEASPRSINYWVKDTGEMIATSNKYHVQEESKSIYATKMIMILRKFQKDDVGSYRCIAKNSVGEVDSSIRLYEIPGLNQKNPSKGSNSNNATRSHNADLFFIENQGGGLNHDTNNILKKEQVKFSYQPSDEDSYRSKEGIDGNQHSSPYTPPQKPSIHHINNNYSLNSKNNYKNIIISSNSESRHQHHQNLNSYIRTNTNQQHEQQHKQPLNTVADIGSVSGDTGVIDSIGISNDLETHNSNSGAARSIHRGFGFLILLRVITELGLTCQFPNYLHNNTEFNLCTAMIVFHSIWLIVSCSRHLFSVDKRRFFICQEDVYILSSTKTTKEQLITATKPKLNCILYNIETYYNDLLDTSSISTCLDLDVLPS